MGITRRPELDCDRWLGRFVRVGVLLGVLCAWAPAVNPAQGPTSWLQGCRGPSTTVRWPAYTDWSAPLQAHGRSMGLRGGDSEEGSASDDQLVSVSFILFQKRFQKFGLRMALCFPVATALLPRFSRAGAACACQEELWQLKSKMPQIWMKHERRSTSGSGIPRVESGIMTA